MRFPQPARREFYPRYVRLLLRTSKEPQGFHFARGETYSKAINWGSYCRPNLLLLVPKVSPLSAAVATELAAI